jgi:hypothetical protein
MALSTMKDVAPVLFSSVLQHVLKTMKSEKPADILERAESLKQVPVVAKTREADLKSSRDRSRVHDQYGLACCGRSAHRSFHREHPSRL